ncbi:MAG: DUF2167 domain-containing protein [Alphaproteobacteria bacterium]|nr:DUF2167 domain-containing protein [Alphaproteobacteria bacterium]
MTEEQRAEAMRHLHWLPSETYKLPASNSALALPSGYHAVLGEDARRFITLSGEPSDPATEAVILSPKFDDEIIFESANEGYVSLDDWKDIDPTVMIDSIRRNTEEANKTRVQQGIEEVHVVGWLQEPTLDRQTSTVYWAIEGATNSGHIVNSIALRLGRNGYERLNWVTDKARYAPIGGQLDLMLRAHSFEPGARYSDHLPGDKTAAYTIAGLVAAVAGAKVIKAVAGVGLLVLFKKLSVLIFGAFAAALYKLKALFRRDPGSGAPRSST